MKIRPVILCGGAGTRLWPKKSNHQAKQFIDFGGWTLINKTFERVKSKVFDYPIISTNSKYIKDVKKALKKSRIKKYKIILEPAKKNCKKDVKNGDRKRLTLVMELFGSMHKLLDQHI